MFLQDYLGNVPRGRDTDYIGKASERRDQNFCVKTPPTCNIRPSEERIVHCMHNPLHKTNVWRYISVTMSATIASYMMGILVATIRVIGVSVFA